MAQAQANFGAILDKPSNEVERPKPLPQGSYTCAVKGLPKYDKSSKKQTEYVEFNLQPLAAGEDVDQDDLNAWMAKVDGSTRKLNEANIRATYYITEDALWRLKKFLDDCGVDEEDKSLRQRIEET